MKLKIPPLLVLLIFIGAMYVLDRFLPVGDFDFFGSTILIYGLLGLSGVIGAVALWHFFRARTTIDPRTPSKASQLVTNGLYAYTRNPMYLSFLLILLAWGLWLGNAFNTLLAAGFVGYMNRFQILPEEEALSRLFGKEYQRYCIAVRRWF